jgi:probable rRNA maturation factor
MHAERQVPDIVVQVAEKFDGLEVDLLRLEKLVRAVCKRFRLSKATISIAIVDDAQIRKVNEQFLGQDLPTDCLSFDLSDGYANCAKSFELLVNAERAIREASLRGHSSEAELALYVTHGLLHNLGFDDSTENRAGEMHDTENEILERLGYGSVYD